MLIQEISKIKIVIIENLSSGQLFMVPLGSMRTGLVTTDLKVALLDNGQHCIINENTAVYCCNLLPISLKK
jgi:hypothetical protein